MVNHVDISNSQLFKKLLRKEIYFGGNKNLEIYGKLNCASGKRMKRKNRAFFASKKEAVQNGFRPCGHCMKKEYKKWKDGFIQ